MDISVSHSSSPNWHLTAAPHGLLAGCVSARFSQRRKQQRRIKHHPAERALSPAPSTPFTPSRPPFLHSPSLSLAAISSGKQFAPQTAPSAHYRSSQSGPVALKSTPPSPSLLRCPPPPPFSPPGFSPMEERHEEDVRILKMFCI